MASLFLVVHTLVIIGMNMSLADLFISHTIKRIALEDK
jgi:hypothetical protein